MGIGSTLVEIWLIAVPLYYGALDLAGGRRWMALVTVLFVSLSAFATFFLIHLIDEKIYIESDVKFWLFLLSPTITTYLAFRFSRKIGSKK